MKRRTIARAAMLVVAFALLACDLGQLPMPRPTATHIAEPEPTAPLATATRTIVVAPTALPPTPIALTTPTPSLKFTFATTVTVPIESSLVSMGSECVSVGYEFYCGGVTGELIPAALEISGNRFEFLAKTKILSEKGKASFPPGGPLNSLKFRIGKLEFSSRGSAGFFSGERVVVGETREGRFYFEGVFPQELLADAGQAIILKARWIKGGEYRLR